MVAGLTVGLTRSARESGMAKLTPLHREVVRGMPGLPEQEVRVLFATLFRATSRRIIRTGFR